MAKLVVRFPDAQTPGYLRFLKALPDLKTKVVDLLPAAQAATLTPAQVDELVDVLLVFVVEPADKAQARELIFDATADELGQLLAGLTERL